MLTAALPVDHRGASRRPAVAPLAQTAARRTSIHDLLDQFADLAHAAEAAARRTAMAR